MFFDDLSEYQYPCFGLDLSKGHYLNVGWLDEGHSYPQGSMSPSLVEKLRKLAASPVNPMRGIHACPFCGKGYPEPLKLLGTAREIWLGCAEIETPGSNGRIYRSPNLVIHYIEEHSYLPPQEFLDALEALA